VPLALQIETPSAVNLDEPAVAGRRLRLSDGLYWREQEREQQEREVIKAHSDGSLAKGASAIQPSCNRVQSSAAVLARIAEIWLK
jgi:hypothetical protein